MIRFGPAGIPLSCKGRTLKDGIEDVHNLSLTAMEIQMVRAGTFQRPADEEEVGKCFGEITEDFAVGIMRDGEEINDPFEPITDEDDIIVMPSPLTHTFGDLTNLGYMAKREDIKLSIRTPYYMDLGDENDLAYNCVDAIIHAGTILNAMGGDIAVTNLGLYDGIRDKDSVDSHIYENMEAVVSAWKSYKLKPRIGVEITGQQDAFGSLEQILDLCKSVKGLTPVINFAHHHARTGGTLLEKDDFISLMEEVSGYCKGNLYMYFSGVEHENGNETRLTPIKKGDLRFETLADALLELRPDCTIISTSPLLEHDAMYMRVIQERNLVKKVARDLREKRKSEMAAAAAGERFG